MALNKGFEYREQIGARGAERGVLVYLAENYRHSTEEQWRSRLESGYVIVDGSPAGAETVLKKGQWLVWRRPPWNEPEAPLAFAVLYEDEDLLAVAKPCGLPCVPGGGFLDHTLLALVRRRYPEAAPVHRLGRGTSGVVLFARTARAGSVLSEALRRREMVKIYRALARGVPVRDSFTVETAIGPVPHPVLGALHAACPGGRPALSRVTLLERRGPDASLLEVCIETGRPHQIRIHLAAAGHPLVGDPLYVVGGGFGNPGTALPGDLGYLLHAERVRLLHPATGSPLEVSCAPPPELRRRDGFIFGEDFHF